MEGHGGGAPKLTDKIQVLLKNEISQNLEIRVRFR
jgi:hypothetical protein